jgi:hypothetical protein
MLSLRKMSYLKIDINIFKKMKYPKLNTQKNKEEYVKPPSKSIQGVLF